MKIHGFCYKLIYDSQKKLIARTPMKYGRNTNKMTETGSNQKKKKKDLYTWKKWMMMRHNY
jgi:hypothetical protein